MREHCVLLLSCSDLDKALARSSPLSKAVFPSVQEAPPALTLRFQPQSVSDDPDSPSHATVRQAPRGSRDACLTKRRLRPGEGSGCQRLCSLEVVQAAT